MVEEVGGGPVEMTVGPGGGAGWRALHPGQVAVHCTAVTAVCRLQCDLAFLPSLPPPLPPLLPSSPRSLLPSLRLPALPPPLAPSRQVYNETVLDLLNPTPQLLSVQEDGKGTSIPGLTLHKVWICVFRHVYLCICVFAARQP